MMFAVIVGIHTSGSYGVILLVDTPLCKCLTVILKMHEIIARDVVPSTSKSVRIAIAVVTQIEHMIPAVVVVRNAVSDDARAGLEEQMHCCPAFQKNYREYGSAAS